MSDQAQNLDSVIETSFSAVWQLPISLLYLYISRTLCESSNKKIAQLSLGQDQTQMINCNGLFERNHELLIIYQNKLHLSSAKFTTK